MQRIQLVEKDLCSRPVEIPGGSQQNNVALLSQLQNVFHRLSSGGPSQFNLISPRKFVEAVQPMVIPSPQFSGRCGVFEPLIETSGLLADPSWPKSIHQHSIALTAPLVIDASQRDTAVR